MIFLFLTIVGDMVEVLQVVPKKACAASHACKNAVEFDPVDKAARVVLSQAGVGQMEGDKKSEGFLAKERAEIVEMFKLVNWRFVLRRPLCGGHVFRPSACDAHFVCWATSHPSLRP